MNLAKTYGHVYTLGELVHNELVTEFLHSNSVDSIELSDIERLKEGDVALIRAHGVPAETERRLRERGIRVEDATCPVVKRNQRIASERASAGDEVIIFGDEKHDEVVGVASYAGDKVNIVPANEMPKIGENPTSILFQTTVLEENFKKIS
ncbi:MAG: hypothetical protein NC037_06435, partial [Bacteroides sp.]|nr:hypothetical protein [Bacteroides sp.]